MDKYQQFSEYVNKFFNNLPPEDFITAQCPFCKNNTNSREMFKKETMRVMRCSCGMVYNERQAKPERLSEFYEKSIALSLWSKIKETGHEIQRQKEKFQKAADFIIENKLSTLDIGCGNGLFLSLVNNEVETLGIDESHVAISACKNRTVNAISSDIDSFIKSNKQEWDCVTIWGVLEHHPNPNQLLKQCKDLIKKNGFIIVCVPNVYSKLVKHLKSESFTYCPQHLWYFNYARLSKILENNGFFVNNNWSIEPELMPIKRWQNGFNPYDKTITKEVLGESTFWPSPEYLEKEILQSMEGYKIVLVGGSV